MAPCAIAAETLDNIAAVTTRSPAVTYTIDTHVFAAGTSVRSDNSCNRLRATIGEPVAGYASNANHALSSGFRAAVQGRRGDDLFFAGFEACP